MSSYDCYFCHLILIFCTISGVISERSLNVSTLRLVQVIWRHGDRTPEYPMPYYEGPNPWKEPLGELTTIGMQQQYELGKYIKHRYAGFLSEEYSPFEIFVRSSGYSRTIESALANLAGMYPTKDDNGLTKNLNWRPIPVHSLPLLDDPVLVLIVPCPAIDVNGSAFIDFNSKFGQQPQVLELLQEIRNRTRWPTLDLKAFAPVYDNLNAQRIHNATNPWPSWVNEDLWLRVKALMDKMYSALYTTYQRQRLRAGLVLGEMYHRMRARQNGTLDHRLKYYAYSAHDLTVMAVLNAFGAHNGMQTPYAGALLVELHEDSSGEYYVEFHFRNDTNREPYRLNVFDCHEGRCSFQQFRDRIVRFVPVDWYKECGRLQKSVSNASENSQIEQRSLGTVFFMIATCVLAVLCVACACALALLLYCHRKLQRQNLKLQQKLKSQPAPFCIEKSVNN